MHKLLRLISWDIKLLVKSGVVAVGLGITAIYMLIIYFTDLKDADQWMIVLLFSDPVMYGFLFSAIIVLFEKDIHIHQVLAITPLPQSYYLISKSIAFSILALLCCLPMLFLYQPQNPHWLYLILAIVLASVLFTLIGIIGALLTRNFNHFILLIPMVLAPVALPFLSFFDLISHALFYLIPTQACLLLFQAGFNPIANGQLIYAIAYQVLFIVMMFVFAQRTLKQKFK